jgi:alkaline phosphatase D
MAPLLHGKLGVSRMRLVPLAARAGSVLLALLLSAGSAPAGLLVTVSDVSPTSALLWMQASEPGPVALRLTPAPPAEVPDRITPGEDGRAVARLRGLEPGRRHQYELRGLVATAAGEFATAPAPETAVPVTLAWSGDLGGRGHCRSPRGWPAVDALAARRLDLFLLVGDTIYADRRCGGHAWPGADFVAKTLDGFRGKHRHNRADPALQRLLRRTPVVAIWDDHDVRNNFSGTTEPLMPVGLQAFLDYWPVAAPAEDPTRL